MRQCPTCADCANLRLILTNHSEAICYSKKTRRVGTAPTSDFVIHECRMPPMPDHKVPDPKNPANLTIKHHCAAPSSLRHTRPHFDGPNC